MPDRTQYALTPSQREELLRLYAVRALGRPSAVHAYADGMGGSNANVIGILREKGFAEVFGRRHGGRTVTHYCLTDAGLRQVEQLTGAPRAGRP